MALTGLILAGGRSSRFGDDDKALADVNGRLLINYVSKQLEPQVDNIVISANQNIESYKNLGYKVIQDQTMDFQGPLAGIASAMENISDLLAVIPCDAPHIPEDLVTRLLMKMNEKEHDVVVVYDGHQLQPLYGLYHCRLYRDIRYFLDRGGRSVKVWLSKQNYATVQFSDSHQKFWNINTQDDLEVFKKEMSFTSPVV